MVLTLAAAACEGAPARSKPWRHAPDPALLAESQPSSDMVTGEAERVAARQRRAHTLRIHMDQEPRHLNPMVAPSIWTMRVAADTIFETLIRYQPPEGGAGAGPGHYAPGLARSFRIGAGGREIRLDLEPDVSFHDGTKMTSVDVQFSLDAARDPRTASEHLHTALAGVSAVELIGPRALRIRLEQPNGYVLRALAEVPILPARTYARQLSASRGPVIGTGPYRIDVWRDDLIRLARFGDYWGRAPAIPAIEFVYEPDAARALTAAKRGEIDLLPGLIPVHYPEQASAPGLVSSFAPLRLRPPQFRYLVMGASRPPLDDVRVRQALALLIDRKSLIKDIYSGLARPIAGPVWPGGPGDGAAPGPPDYDPETAAKLLDAAGWRDHDGDGVRDREGQPLRFSLLVLDSTSSSDAEEKGRVLSNFRRSGMLVDMRVGTAAVLRKRMADGDFDLVFAEWRGVVDDDLGPLLETGGTDNFGRFSHRRADAVLAALRAVWEPGSRAPLMSELARVLAETWPFAPIAAPDPYGLLHRRVQGAVIWNGWLSLRELSLDAADDADSADDAVGAAATGAAAE